MRAVHQFVPMLHRDDAVGRHTLRIRDVLRGRGIPSDIYVEMIDPETERETRLFTSYDQGAGGGNSRSDLLVYQFATASNIAPWLAARPETLAISYHNVTPPELYAAWNNPMARHQLRAMHELTLLASRTTLAIAVSQYNESQLREHGYQRTSVVPPAAMAPTTPATATATTSPPVGSGSTTSDGGTEPSTNSDAARWLAVGRVAPNKGIELAIMALLVTRAHYDPRATLEVIGRPVVPAYTRALQRFVAELGLYGAVSFRGKVTDEQLVAAMAGADALVMASQHEGFGVPVIEAMAMGLPVVANRSGALPEIVGNGGLLVDAKDPYALSAALHDVTTDAALRATLEQAAARRVQSLDLASAGDRLVDLLSGI